MVNFDAIHGEANFTKIPIADLVKLSFSFADDRGSHIDSISWNWGEGHHAPYPSRIMPLYDHPGYRKWAQGGVNLPQIFLEETRKRGLEVFYSYRINGSDNDLGPVAKIPRKEAHPDWLIPVPWGGNGLWNFAIEEVRQYKLKILKEVVEQYDFDGLELDFARNCPVLPPGQQWELREHMTDFMRAVRALTQDAERKRRRAFLVSARVGENLEGCHMDGLAVETWAREQLVDIFALGCRSLEVDLEAFRRITAGTSIRLQPCLDEHHSSDGYNWPPIEVVRGVYANWWDQGADGVYTFNWNYARHDQALGVGLHGAPHFAEPGPLHRQLYKEIGDPEELRFRDKTFVVQRRGGGHGPRVVPNPEDWHTPRVMYANTNMFAPLPAPLDVEGKADTLLTVYVADNLKRHSFRIQSVGLRILLSDAATAQWPAGEKIPRAVIRVWRGRDFLYNSPPLKGVENQLEVRLNNALLDAGEVKKGWLVFRPRPNQFARGNNVLGLRLEKRVPKSPMPILVEKVEVDVRYKNG